MRIARMHNKSICKSRTEEQWAANLFNKAFVRALRSMNILASQILFRWAQFTLSRCCALFCSYYSLSRQIYWDSIGQKKSIKEKREYDIQGQPDGSTVRRLKMTTGYAIDGNAISEVERNNSAKKAAGHYAQ